MQITIYGMRHINSIISQVPELYPKNMEGEETFSMILFEYSHNHPFPRLIIVPSNYYANMNKHLNKKVFGRGISTFHLLEEIRCTTQRSEYLGKVSSVFSDHLFEADFDVYILTGYGHTKLERPDIKKIMKGDVTKRIKNSSHSLLHSGKRCTAKKSVTNIW